MSPRQACLRHSCVFFCVDLSVRLPVDHRPLSDLDGGKLLVVAVGQTGALFPVSSGAAG